MSTRCDDILNLHSTPNDESSLIYGHTYTRTHTPGGKYESYRVFLIFSNFFFTNILSGNDFHEKIIFFVNILLRIFFAHTTSRYDDAVPKGFHRWDAMVVPTRLFTLNHERPLVDRIKTCTLNIAYEKSLQICPLEILSSVRGSNGICIREIRIVCARVHKNRILTT